MAGYSTVTINGNIGREPETRITTNGKTVCSCSVAINDGSERNEHTSWVSVTAWDRTGEILAGMGKGQPVCIIGRLREDQWQTKDGEKRSRLGVVADRVYRIERSNQGERQDEPPQPRQARQEPEQRQADDQGAMPF